MPQKDIIALKMPAMSRHPEADADPRVKQQWTAWTGICPNRISVAGKRLNMPTLCAELARPDSFVKSERTFVNMLHQNCTDSVKRSFVDSELQSQSAVLLRAMKNAFAISYADLDVMLAENDSVKPGQDSEQSETK
jgi:hypothetical protein